MYHQVKSMEKAGLEPPGQEQSEEKKEGRPWCTIKTIYLRLKGQELSHHSPELRKASRQMAIFLKKCSEAGDMA